MTATVAPASEQGQPTGSGQAASPYLITTVVTAVDSLSYTTTVDTDDQFAALTIVITAVDSVSRTVGTVLTLAPTSTLTIGDWFAVALEVA